MPVAATFPRSITQQGERSWRWEAMEPGQGPGLLVPTWLSP